MKLKHLTLLTALALCALLFAFNHPEDAIAAKTLKHATSIDLTSVLIKMEAKRHQAHFDKIKLAVLEYNPKVSDKTIEDILTSIETFNLNESKEMLSYSVYQILYESQGKHRNKKGELIRSSANALGITQLKVVTAFHYLRLEMDQAERDILVELGGSKINFTDKDMVSKGKNSEGKTIWITPKSTKLKVAKWMENETNCILLWGYIMRHNTDEHTFYDALVIYNAGKGGWKSYKGLGVENHSYLRGIRKVEKYLKQKGATI